jgi:hypothetical protein
MPPHLYLKRAFVLESVFGTMDEHADRIAQMGDVQRATSALPGD